VGVANGFGRGWQAGQGAIHRLAFTRLLPPSFANAMPPKYWSYLLCLLASVSGYLAHAQPKLPLIRATSSHVSIRDGGYLDKNSWTLSPKARPDVYTADRTRETKWVTFYTDLDSLRLQVKPGTRTNFIILLNGKDSCYTQLVSAVAPAPRRPPTIAPPDTIPFTLTAFNAIQVKAVLNGQDTLKLHFDSGSFEVRLTQEAILKKTHLLANQPATLAGTVAPNYNRLSPVTKLQMGTFVLNQPQVLATGITAQEMDGRFGYSLFEGKQLEVDYDHHWLLVHAHLPKVRRGYTKNNLKFIRSFVCVNAHFTVEQQQYAGDFLLDTGSSQAVILDSTWISQNHFPQNLKLLKTQVVLDPRGTRYETPIVQAPAFHLGQTTLVNVPTNLLPGKNPVRFPVNYLGNDLLKRFNLIFDFQHDVLYLKPNKLWNSAFRERA
jgi:hypothetical protein